MSSHVNSMKRRALTPLTDEDWENNRRYGVIIDAGSSGSRVYVYSWKDHDFMKSTHSIEELKGTIPIVERADKNGLKWTHRQEPGISTFGSKPKEVGDHLKGLLDFAQEVVPRHLRPSTPVFMMATAGMRLLPLDEQQVLMETSCRYIKENSAFLINDCNTHIQTIPGELEGVYGWVAVNYLMGGFDASIQSDKQQQKHTFGFLDMGGASTQIAFEPDHHQKEEHVADLTKIHLRTLDGSAVDYDIFVTTFLGYGSNEARRRYLEQRVKMLFDDQERNRRLGNIDDMATTGSTVSANITKGLLDEHHRLHLDDPCLPLNLELTDTDTTSVSLQLKGTGDFAACLDATLPLLNKNAECPTQPCLFNGVHTPQIDWSVHQFVGISEYWYTSHDVLGLGGVYDFNEYERKATSFCGKDWSLALEEHPDWNSVEIQRYQLQCFKSAWMVNVLHGGIEVPRQADEAGNSNMEQHLESTGDVKWMEQSIESVEHKNWNPPFQSIDTINDIQVSWTLGAMLLHVANQIPLVDHGGNVIHGISGDDEQSHLVADGVELPLADAVHDHHHGTILSAATTITSGETSNHFYASVPEDNTGAASWLDLGNTVSIIGLVSMLIVLVGVVLWEWYRHSKKRRRSYGGGDYRRVDTNGGILGNVAVGPTSTRPSSPTQPFSTLLSTLLDGSIMALKQITARPMVVLRYWTSRILTRRGNSELVTDDNVGVSGNTGLDHLETNRYYYHPQQDSTIVYQQQLLHQQHSQLMEQQVSQTPSPLQSPFYETLGPSTKSPSMISMKYWRKKRYSGDSHHISQLIQPVYGNDNNYDYGGATSAMMGYPNRSNSISNLVARTSSPMLSGEGPVSSAMSMSRSRSRIGFSAYEISDEGGDYLNFGSDHNNTSPDLHRLATTGTSRTPSPSQVTLISKRTTVNTPSPKCSPRSSLEKGTGGANDY
ncbi:nucleoside phosphatase family-domain-containing protein [Chlamydoabsidia padenii]|nr:nucleoside phosphatase family-domain-containing protein [Chlamydoabsidia padenii]